MVKATLSNYRQSPRKVRLVADAVRGKKIDAALTALAFLNKRAADPFKRLIESAIANAKSNLNVEKEALFVKEIRVDQGVTLKRSMPRARGRASRINKRSSHVYVVLDDVKNMKTKKKASAKASTASKSNA